jgi:hypothetical protein
VSDCKGRSKAFDGPFDSIDKDYRFEQLRVKNNPPGLEHVWDAANDLSDECCGRGAA